MRFVPAIRRSWLRKSFFLLLVLITLVGITAPIWLPAIGYWLAEPASLQSADAIAVHGSSRNRTSYGVELYQQGMAPELLHTGFAEHQTSITQYVIQQGMPLDRFKWLSTTSTWTDAEQIALFAREHKLNSVLVVTDWWHSRRALCADAAQFRDSGITIYYAPAEGTWFGPANWWRYGEGRRTVGSELLKFAYYTVRYGMSPWNC